MKRVILIEKRISAGLTQEQLGRHIGISKQSICDIERGRRSPSWQVAQQLEHVFGVSARELLALEVEEREAG